MLQNNNAIWTVMMPQAGGWHSHALGERTVIGSADDCDIHVAHLAKRQVRLQVQGEQLLVFDLGSEAGVEIDGEKLSSRPVPLGDGQVMRLGRMPVVALRQEVRDGQAWLQFGQMGSHHLNMHRVFVQLALAAASPWPLMLLGESGTGKELAARAVHERSQRRKGPWLAVNCATLTGDTLLAELFGAAKGAYTGCVENRRGAFEKADGGTLFLDEIGELPPVAQAALLRVLETGEVQVLGGGVRQVDVRIVCATHRDLAAATLTGHFRLDLLHRLGVAEVHLPSLRQRPDDILPLLRELLPDLTLPRAADALLKRQTWPGNVRQLRNLARRLQMNRCFDQPDMAELQLALMPNYGQLLTQPSDFSGVAENAAPTQPDERRDWVATLLQDHKTTAEALHKSGLPKGTFFRYVKMIRLQNAA